MSSYLQALPRFEKSQLGVRIYTKQQLVYGSQA